MFHRTARCSDSKGRPVRLRARSSLLITMEGEKSKLGGRHICQKRRTSLWGKNCGPRRKRSKYYKQSPNLDLKKSNFPSRNYRNKHGSERNKESFRFVTIVMPSLKIIRDKSALFVRKLLLFHETKRFLAAHRCFIILASSEHQFQRNASVRHHKFYFSVIYFHLFGLRKK